MEAEVRDQPVLDRGGVCVEELAKARYRQSQHPPRAKTSRTARPADNPKHRKYFGVIGRLCRVEGWRYVVAVGAVRFYSPLA